MHVVLIHGYMAPGAIMRPIAWRIRRAGHSTEIFSYPSMWGSVERHARGLAATLEQSGGRCSVVAHSLGGLILKVAMTLTDAHDIESCVFIATPHRGSHRTRQARFSVLGPFISDAAKTTSWGVAEPSYPGSVGVIFGTRDRVVSPSEASLASADDQLELPYGHNELLFRSRTATAVVSFLCRGSFQEPS